MFIYLFHRSYYLLGGYMGSKKSLKIRYRMDGDMLRITIVTRDAKKVVDALREALKPG